MSTPKATTSQEQSLVQFDALEPRQLLASYFVSTTGNDSNNGSSDAPWRTLQRAANLVQPGDNVLEVGFGTGANIELLA